MFTSFKKGLMKEITKSLTRNVVFDVFHLLGSSSIWSSTNNDLWGKWLVLTVTSWIHNLVHNEHCLYECVVFKLRIGTITKMKTTVRTFVQRMHRWCHVWHEWRLFVVEYKNVFYVCRMMMMRFLKLVQVQVSMILPLKRWLRCQVCLAMTLSFMEIILSLNQIRYDLVFS